MTRHSETGKALRKEVVPYEDTKPNEEDDECCLNDLWMELPVTIAIAVCISAAVGFVQNALLHAVRSLVLPR